jgi:Skp family chaperone for outer membrane proteins
MERMEKEFHLKMHEALMEWKVELEEKHEREIDHLEGKHKRELQRLQRTLLNNMEADKANAMEEMRRRDQAEIETLKEQVTLLKKGWKKERQEWQSKKQTLEKDLDPTSLFNLF